MITRRRMKKQQEPYLHVPAEARQASAPSCSVPLDSSSKWYVNMEKEEVTAVALGSFWVAAARSLKYLRIFSMQSVQMYTFLLDGPVVVASGYEDELAVVTHSSQSHEHGLEGYSDFLPINLEESGWNASASADACKEVKKGHTCWIVGFDSGNSAETAIGYATQHKMELVSSSLRAKVSLELHSLTLPNSCFFEFGIPEETIANNDMDKEAVNAREQQSTPKRAGDKQVDKKGSQSKGKPFITDFFGGKQ
nr:hypothetical protein [Tanacetum cinerariifolium]